MVKLILFIWMLFLIMHMQNLFWWMHLQDPLTDAYKEKWRWWSAVELARRFIIILFVLSYPRNFVSNQNYAVRPKDYPIVYYQVSK